MNRHTCCSQPTTMSDLVRLVTFAVALVAVAPCSLTAQDGLGFEFAFGYQAIGGDYGEALKGGIDGEFAIVYTRNKFRYGVGTDWASYELENPNEDVQSWSNVAFHLGVAYFLTTEGRVRPFVEARMVGRRLRPEGSHLGPEVPPGEEPPEEGENTSEIRVFGMSGAALAGVEIGMTQRSWLKLAGYWGPIDTEDADFGEYDVDLDTFNTGTVFGFRIGIVWTP